MKTTYSFAVAWILALTIVPPTWAGTIPPPVITCPVLVTEECTGGLTPVDFTVTAVDGNGSPLTVTCLPPSGSNFPKGTSPVACNTMDNLGQMDSCNFNVTVEDTVLPQVTCPGDISVPATGPAGAVVNYVAACSDACGINSFDCAPPSGTTFPIGMTTTTCNCVDGAGNPNSCDFKVTVMGQVAQVAIDAKPGSDPNSFNCGSKGNIPVAILGAAGFDATTVQVSSVTLKGAVDTIHALPKSQVIDVNADTFLDLIVYFDSTAVAGAIGCPLPSGTTSPVTVGGMTSGGTAFTATDVLRITRNKK